MLFKGIDETLMISDMCDSIMKFLSKNMQKIIDDSQLYLIGDDILIKLLRKNSLVVNSEYELFKAIIYLDEERSKKFFKYIRASKIVSRRAQFFFCLPKQKASLNFVKASNLNNE